MSGPRRGPAAHREPHPLLRQPGRGEQRRTSRCARASCARSSGPTAPARPRSSASMSGEMAPSAGRVLLPGGTTSPGCRSTAVCRLGIAKSYQITNIFPHLSVLENVRVAVQGYARSFNFWSRADALDRRARTAPPRSCATVSLARQAEQLAAHLSHGEKRHLEIGIALASDPVLLLLDEPTAGMSPEETDETMRAHPRAGPRPHGGAGRAQDEAGDGHLRPRHRAAPGPGAGRRHARGDPRQPRSCRRPTWEPRDEPPRRRRHPHLLRRGAHPPGRVAHGGRGRGRDAHRAQRRGQDHHAAVDHGHRAGPARRGAPGRRRHHASSPPTRSSGAASPGCRRSAACCRT